jgi:hypothetical protein
MHIPALPAQYVLSIGVVGDDVRDRHDLLG